MIIKSKCVVIVEGAGDVWRLDEAGILNAVAMNGSKLSTIQDILIEECSPAHVVILTDDNPAGNECAETITRKWSRLSHVHRIKPIGVEEVSDMTTDDVAKHFRGMIENWMK